MADPKALPRVPLDPVRVLVTASRDWNDEIVIMRELNKLNEVLQKRGYDPGDVVLVHGAARGGDTIAEACAKQLGWQTEAHPVPKEYNAKYGARAAPIMRNKDMVDLGAWICLAFWDGDTPGTLDCLKRAVKAGIPVKVTPMRKAA